MGETTKLREIIEDNDTNIQELAQAIGVKRKQITRWANEQQEMGIYKLKSICEYYKISADYILGLPDDLDRPR